MPSPDMRLIEVMLLSEGVREDVLDVLEAAGLEYNVSDRTDEPSASGLVSCPIPAPNVEAIQERLAGIDSDGEIYTVVYDPETVVSNRFDGANATVDAGGPLSPDRISRRELHSRTADLLPDGVIYAALTAVSAVVMAAGVLLESLSVLIGAMVIAPMLGPAVVDKLAGVATQAQALLAG